MAHWDMGNALRAHVLVWPIVVALAGCRCPDNAPLLEPAVVDVLPADVYLLVHPIEGRWLPGMSVRVMDDGNLEIFGEPPHAPGFKTPLPRVPDFPLHFAAAGRMATTKVKDSSSWELDRSGGHDARTAPRVEYTVQSVRLGESPHPLPDDGPHISAVLVGAFERQCGTIDPSPCGAGDDTTAFAVIVSEPSQAREARGNKAQPAPPQ